MKVKVDENLPREVADLLRDAGHDAITVGAEGLSGGSDGTIAATIRREGPWSLDARCGLLRHPSLSARAVRGTCRPTVEPPGQALPACCR